VIGGAGLCFDDEVSCSRDWFVLLRQALPNSDLTFAVQGAVRPSFEALASGIVIYQKATWRLVFLDGRVLVLLVAIKLLFYSAKQPTNVLSVIFFFTI